MKTRKLFITILCYMLGSIVLFAQSDPYEAQRSTTERLRKENKYDSMLIEAGKLRSWTILNERDTSLRHPLSLRILGQAFEYKQKADSAIKNYTLALEILKKQNRYEHIEFARTLHTLGSYQNVLGRYKESEKSFLEVIDLYQKMKMENSLDYAKSLNNMGMLYDKIGNRSSAEKAYKQSLEIKKAILGDQNPDYARSLENLGLVYSGYDDFKAAKPYLVEALEIRKSALGENHPDYARSLYNLGLFYLNQGDFQTASPLMKQSLEIRKKVFGENHLDYIRNLVGMGVLYSEYEDYKEAGDCFRKTTELYKKNLGDQHIDYALSLANLAAIHKKMGDYITAEKLNLQAIAVKKKAVGENDKTYLTNLANLSNIYMNMGQFKKADSLYRLVLNAQRNVFGEKNMGYISTAMNLGWLHIYRGNYAIADSFLLSTLNQIKSITGTKNSDYALNLGLLGKLNARKLDFSLAESYYLESIDVYNELYGKEIKSVASMKAELAMLYVRMGREKEAFDIMTEVMKSKTKQISDNFEWLNDNQKETYWKEEKDFYDHLSWLANQTFQKVPEVASLNYNSALITKSKLLEAKISSENYHREVDEIREELVQRRRLITKMESEGSEEKKKLETLRSEADSLDKRLAMGWPEYAEQKKNLSITWQQVKQQLELNEAAIEFVRFKNEDDSLYYYNALVLRKDAPQPQLVKLCKEKDLKNISPKMGFSAFYPLIWDPMEDALKGISTIYYAPTGLLYNVPFPALYALKGKGDQIVPEKTDKHGMIMESAKVTTEENASFLLDRYTLHQLTSTRYLAMGLKQKAKNPISKDMAMVGGVNYDYLPGSNPVELKKGKKDKNATRSSESASGKLAFLEGTKVEIDQIQSTAAQNTWTTTVLSGDEAKEENIVQLEGKEAKGILHLATHGYSFPEYDFNDSTIPKNSLRYSYRFSQNPMVRSGLILAGGNWAWTGSDTLTKLGAEQNGVLTASEVAQLNLKKTKLVVLSACETGLGTIDGSEGTFGLKRGFKLAGVEQMIVSLWSVSDKETMELMTLFYSDLTKTLNPIASFEKAQKEMRNKYPQEPEKWAGFVLVR